MRGRRRLKLPDNSFDGSNKALGPDIVQPQGSSSYNSTASISVTKRFGSAVKNAATTSNTASLKPPMFKMSLRSGACVVA
jgi:hypothetical protein